MIVGRLSAKPTAERQELGFTIIERQSTRKSSG
jgi:hypothetical protein